MRRLLSRRCGRRTGPPAVGVTLASVEPTGVCVCEARSGVAAARFAPQLSGPLRADEDSVRRSAEVNAEFAAFTRFQCGQCAHEIHGTAFARAVRWLASRNATGGTMCRPSLIAT